MRPTLRGVDASIQQGLAGHVVVNEESVDTPHRGKPARSLGCGRCPLEGHGVVDREDDGCDATESGDARTVEEGNGQPLEVNDVGLPGPQGTDERCPAQEMGEALGAGSDGPGESLAASEEDRPELDPGGSGLLAVPQRAAPERDGRTHLREPFAQGRVVGQREERGVHHRHAGS